MEEQKDKQSHIENSKMNQDNQEKKKPDLIAIICVAVGVVLIIVALSQLIPAIYHYITEEDAYTDLRDEYVKVDDEAQKKQNHAEEADKDWWYDNISIDLLTLQEQNEDVAAWIRFDEMDLSYPVMYSGDNEKYLHRDLSGEDSNAGSLFIDAKNTPDFTDGSTIIYGHNMKNLSMFGRLKKYKKDGFYDKNQYFTVYTDDKAYRYHIFSYFDISEGNDFFQTNYDTEDKLSSLISTMKKSSYLDTGVKVEKSDKIVTLSTCSAEDKRFLVNAVLVAEHDMTQPKRTTQ